jgi:transposase
MKVAAGIDVGKAELDVSIATGSVRRFANSTAGITALVGWVKAEGVTVAVCEPTGGYERQLVRRLRQALPAVVVAHPNKVRAFARACGEEAKTDRLDAQVLSRYASVMELTATPAPSPERELLQDVLQRRQQLVGQRVQELNRLDKGLSSASLSSVTRHIRWLDKEIARLDDKYTAIVQRSQQLRQRAQLLRSMRGVGELTAAILAAFLPELGHLPGKALTALAGLAPWSRDSGQQRGYRAIRGGRGVVRRALYLAALSAIRQDNSLRRFYQGLRQRGKPGKVALVAVMRKMLLQLNAIVRRGSPWQEFLPQTA